MAWPPLKQHLSKVPTLAFKEDVRVETVARKVHLTCQECMWESER